MAGKTLYDKLWDDHLVNFNSICIWLTPNECLGLALI